MLHVLIPKPQPPRVTVKFRTGAHSFLLPDGATLADLANRIVRLGARHHNAPISIAVAFDARRGEMAPLKLRDPPTSRAETKER